MDTYAVPRAAGPATRCSTTRRRPHKRVAAGSSGSPRARACASNHFEVGGLSAARGRGAPRRSSTSSAAASSASWRFCPSTPSRCTARRCARSRADGAARVAGFDGAARRGPEVPQRRAGARRGGLRNAARDARASVAARAASTAGAAQPAGHGRRRRRRGGRVGADPCHSVPSVVHRG